MNAATTSASSPSLAGPPGLRQTFARMLRVAGAQGPALRRSLWLSAAAAAAQGLAFACFYPLLAAVLRDPPDTAAAWRWLAALGACALADWVLRWQAHGFDYSHRLGDVTHDLRVRLGEQLRRMPLEALHRRRTGELSAVLAGNVDEVVTPMGAVSAIILRSLIVPAVAVAATLFVDWRLALAMMVLFPLALPLHRARRRTAARTMHDLAAAHARTAAELVEYVQGLPVLRAARCTGTRAARLQDALAGLRTMQEDAQARDMRPTLLTASLVEIGLVVVLALGVWRVLGGGLDVAALAALLVVVVRFAEPLSMLSGLSAVFDHMEAGFAQIEQVLAIPPLPMSSPPAVPQAFGVRFDDVDFRYAGQEAGEPALRGIDCHLPPRSLTALVGPSGSGKTTVTRLLMRHADPQRGRVLIGGADVRAIAPATLNALISVVFQDVYLFDDSILANIRMARPGATDEEVEAAARAAHCHEFIARLPDGYRTRVGDIGGRLSGGECQRISIARALLKDAPIVVLDEPTAALDSESEVAVQQAIDALVRDRTVIVIAHRLSTVVGADQILVLDDGRIVERGTHAELIAADGRYQAMWQAQQQAKSWHPGQAD
ncbi:MAG: ABC transporter ATP-binding protein [Rhodocyclaceae bacterium]|nr:ABC transporter ATP-binding protein [Rhodocyclaceae bacterium]